MDPTNGVIFPLLGIILIGVKISGKWVIPNKIPQSI